MRFTILMIAALLSAGCVTSRVVPLDESNYLVSIHTMYGITSRSTLNQKTADKAQLYCAQQGKVAHIKNIAGTGIVGLTNLSSTVVFSCEMPAAAASH